MVVNERVMRAHAARAALLVLVLAVIAGCTPSSPEQNAATATAPTAATAAPAAHYADKYAAWSANYRDAGGRLRSLVEDMVANRVAIWSPDASRRFEVAAGILEPTDRDVLAFPTPSASGDDKDWAAAHARMQEAARQYDALIAEERPALKATDYNAFLRIYDAHARPAHDALALAEESAAIARARSKLGP